MRKITVLLFLLIYALAATAQTLPEMQIQTLTGKDVNVAAIAGNGKPVMMLFYATWCKPAANQLKAITRQYADWQKETGVQMIVVSVDKAQDRQKLQNVFKQNNWKYDVLLDTDGALKRAMTVQMIPHLFIINGRGEVVKSHRGYTDGAESRIAEELKNIL
ncbi:MAG: TlpA family protein disulfide reductase [Paludibacteraceae bacterium]|nr:TlpA family protein disulfide reductase [Paludibacteraceae bacterium]